MEDQLVQNRKLRKAKKAANLKAVAAEESKRKAMVEAFMEAERVENHYNLRDRITKAQL